MICECLPILESNEAGREMSPHRNVVDELCDDTPYNAANSPSNDRIVSNGSKCFPARLARACFEMNGFGLR